MGRTGVFELLVVTDHIRDMIRESPNLLAIRQEAIKNCMKHLRRMVCARSSRAKPRSRNCCVCANSRGQGSGVSEEIVGH